MTHADLVNLDFAHFVQQWHRSSFDADFGHAHALIEQLVVLGHGNFMG